MDNTNKVAEALIARGEELIAKTATLKQWCLDNYTNGADTMVECWEDADFHDLLVENDFSVEKSLEVLARVASVYRDQQADAAYYARERHES